MKTLNDYIVNGALYQGGTGPEAQVGDQVKLFLDTEAVPGFPAFIVGVIQHPIVKVQCDTATSYDIEYDEADLLGAAAFIVPDNVIDAQLILATDVLEDALNAEIARATAAEAAIQADVDQNEADADAAIAAVQADVDQNEADGDAEDAAIRVDFAAADDLLAIRPIERTALEGAPLDQVVGQAQIIRIDPTGNVTTAGDAILSLDSTLIVGSPKAYDVPVLLADGATEIAAAIFAVLNADSDVTDKFAVANGGTFVTLTTLAQGGYFPADDPSLQLDILDNTSVGVDTVVSTDTQSGIATVDATDPVHIGRWCRVGDAAPFDWYQADTLTTWLHRWSGKDPVGFNGDQSVYQKLVISGLSGSEIVTVTDL